MINKEVGSVAEAVADVFDGATVMLGGFGEAGSPIELIVMMTKNKVYIQPRSLMRQSQTVVNSASPSPI